MVEERRIRLLSVISARENGRSCQVRAEELATGLVMIEKAGPLRFVYFLRELWTLTSGAETEAEQVRSSLPDDIGGYWLQHQNGDAQRVAAVFEPVQGANVTWHAQAVSLDV